MGVDACRHAWGVKIAGALAIGAALLAVSPAAATTAPRIEVLSNRADLISGGDALVAVQAPPGVRPSSLRITLGGRNISSRFATRADDRFATIVRGLRNGRNVLKARVAQGPARSVVITNHPNGGPVLSGPQVQPWVCQDDAVDKKCNEPVEFSYRYMSEDDGLEPYDPRNPPSDVASTTTDEGVTVPFIVRIETGYQDRDQYKIATLFQPGERWAPWAPQKQWNHKLLIMHGHGCGVSYGAGSAPALFGPLSAGIVGVDDVIRQYSDDVGGTALGRGFAVMSTALNNNSHNCNIAVQAESMIMAKEHLIETYGPVRYTIAAGCSGGSVTQQQVANAYPGLYQGLTPQCSYPDTFSPGVQFADYHLLRQYFENPSRWGAGIAWLPTAWGPVEGHLAGVNAITADEGLFKNAIDPMNHCNGVTDEQLYNPQTNPRGVRCDALEYMINVLGPRPRSVWSPTERKIGRGFAGVPFGNIGVQYGLSALRSGAISADQFVDLNAAIGGISVEDFTVTPQRMRADPGALNNAYRSGAYNEANNLDQVAIINLGGPDPGIAHDYSHAWFMRSRLEREQGQLGNYVMWFGQIPVLGDLQFRTQAFLAMDRWLGAVERDHRNLPLSRKIVEDRPADIVDRCENIPGIETPGGICEIPLLQTRLGTPRTVAGAGIASDVGACRLTPLRRTGYYPADFTDSQWAKLERIFRSGVCDWSKPGIGQRDTIAWLSYQRPDGSVVHGGRPLGSAPAGSGSAWTSSAFSAWRRSG